MTLVNWFMVLAKHVSEQSLFIFFVFILSQFLKVLSDSDHTLGLWKYAGLPPYKT